MKATKVKRALRPYGLDKLRLTRHPSPTFSAVGPKVVR